MRLGSFTLDGTTINVDTDFDQITGLIYKFVRADNGHQIAFTTYKGMELTAGAKIDKADLQRGLDSVRKPIRRLPSWAAACGARRPTSAGSIPPDGTRPGQGCSGRVPGRRVVWLERGGPPSPDRLVDGRARPGRATPGARPGPM